MNKEEASYLYQSIVASEKIRVLRLEPGMFWEPLVGSFSVQKIPNKTDSQPDETWIRRSSNIGWDCVSYCWGPQKNYTYFSCNGNSLRITRSVDDMLRHLQEPLSTQYL
jgi:hypothetical protein